MTEPAPEGWTFIEAGEFMGLIGPLLRSTKDRQLYALKTHAAHKNHIGLVHGGVLTGLLDQVLALAAWNAADRQPVVTVQMDTRFLGAARAGELLEARAHLRHATRSMLFVDAEIGGANGPVAAASGVMKIARKSGQTT